MKRAHLGAILKSVPHLRPSWTMPGPIFTRAGKEMIVMNMLKRYLANTLIGGIGVVLPVAIILYALYLVFIFLRGLIRPLSSLLVEFEVVRIAGWIDLTLADILTMGLLMVAFFFIGMFVRTRIGKFFHRHIEDKILSKLPGYTVTKEVISNIAGFSEIKFSRVVLCKPFGGDVLQTGFVMDVSEKEGMITVFCPTGPNPTTGFVYHIPQDQVYPLDVSVDKGVKSIIGCGVGSNQLIKEYSTKYTIVE